MHVAICLHTTPVFTTLAANLATKPTCSLQGLFMKFTKILMVLICIAAAQAASAQEKKLSPAKMTCADYVAVDEAYRPALIYWVAGVDKLGVKETDTLVVDTVQPVGETVTQACTQDPHASFVSKVRSMIKAKKLSLFEHS
jgi:acid stress chaperone HdeA